MFPVYGIRNIQSGRNAGSCPLCINLKQAQRINMPIITYIKGWPYGSVSVPS